MTLVIIAAAVALILGGIGGYLIFRYVAKGKFNEMMETAEKEAEVLKEKKLLEVKDKFLNKKAELEKEVQARNQKIQQNENRLKQREISLNQRQEELGRRKQDVDQGGQRDSQKQVLRHRPEILEHSITSEYSEFINVRNAGMSSPAEDTPANVSLIKVYDLRHTFCGFLGRGSGGNHSLASKEWFPPESLPVLPFLDELPAGPGGGQGLSPEFLGFHTGLRVHVEQIAVFGRALDVQRRHSGGRRKPPWASWSRSTLLCHPYP